MLVKINRRDAALYDLYHLNILTGGLTLVAANTGDIINWVTDSKGEIIARYRRLDDGGWVLERKLENDRWSLAVAGGADESFTTQGYSQDGRTVWALSNVGRDKTSLIKFDLERRQETVVFNHPQVDVDGLWLDREAYQPLEAQIWPGYPRSHYFDRKLAKDLESFRSNVRARVRVRSFDRAQRFLTVEVETERSGRSTFLFDRSSGSKTLLAKSAISKHADVLSPVRPVSFQARDGLTLHGYLTLPTGTEGENLPMVLRVHGGPWWRDYWGYHAVDQMLANRGYAVLSVNFRGSAGYGRAFLQASRREFAGKMHNDLIDGVTWAVEEGIADPEKVAIYGHSYGGYAALVGLTFTPEVFAAAVNVVGVADLVRTAETFPPYWKNWLHRWLDYVGDPAVPEDREDMAARSPINFVSRIKRPLLMVQGANDVRVVREHSDRIAQAMTKAGLPFEYVVFEDEGHAIRKWQNRLAFARHLEVFLANHLGGRTGEDLVR